MTHLQHFYNVHLCSKLTLQSPSHLCVFTLIIISSVPAAAVAADSAAAVSLAK